MKIGLETVDSALSAIRTAMGYSIRIVLREGAGHSPRAISFARSPFSRSQEQIVISLIVLVSKGDEL
ncbi:hypothetical protein X759_21270 [Mesorhizobium sp. LSHC420B00]|nr:hypothetical protein X759_21270 [Mesorhizobium sp. LSHC420B00]